MTENYMQSQQSVVQLEHLPLAEEFMDIPDLPWEQDWIYLNQRDEQIRLEDLSQLALTEEDLANNHIPQLILNDNYTAMHPELPLTASNPRILKAKAKKQFINSWRYQDPIQEQCVICQKQFLKRNKIPVLKCGHLFHKTCLLNQMKKRLNCPLCRANFTNIEQ